MRDDFFRGERLLLLEDLCTAPEVLLCDEEAAAFLVGVAPARFC